MIKKLWFGFFLIALAISSVFVAGKIVQYLSNKAQVNVDVSSPIEISVDDGTFNVYGGESFLIDMDVINHANLVLSGNMTTTITNEDELTCGDFAAISVFKSINNFDNMTYAPVCNEINSTAVEIVLYNKPFAWAALEQDNLLINITMDVGATGEYVLETQIWL